MREADIHSLIAERRTALDEPKRRKRRRLLLAIALVGLAAFAAVLLLALS